MADSCELERTVNSIYITYLPRILFLLILNTLKFCMVLFISFWIAAAIFSLWDISSDEHNSRQNTVYRTRFLVPPSSSDMVYRDDTQDFYHRTNQIEIVPRTSLNITYIDEETDPLTLIMTSSRINEETVIKGETSVDSVREEPCEGPYIPAVMREQIQAQQILAETNFSSYNAAYPHTYGLHYNIRALNTAVRKMHLISFTGNLSNKVRQINLVGIEDPQQNINTVRLPPYNQIPQNATTTAGYPHNVEQAQRHSQEPQGISSPNTQPPRILENISVSSILSQSPGQATPLIEPKPRKPCRCRNPKCKRKLKNMNNGTENENEERKSIVQIRNDENDTEKNKVRTINFEQE